MTYITFNKQELDQGIQSTLSSLYLQTFPYPYSSFDSLVQSYAPLQAQTDMQQFLVQITNPDTALQRIEFSPSEDLTNEIVNGIGSEALLQIT